MEEIRTGLKAAEDRFRELKEQYTAHSTEYEALRSGRSKKQDRIAAFWKWHDKAVEFFGSFDKLLTAGSLEKANRDGVWYTEHGETAVNLLETIALHYETATGQAADLKLTGSPPKPSRTAFAATQRIAAETNPSLAREYRDRFVRLGLPTHGFDTDETEKASTHSLEWRFFAFGCVLAVVATGFAVWGFSLGELTPDQRRILVWVLPLASGFSAWCFSGTVTAKAKDWHNFFWGATGGSAVWAISFFWLFPR